MTKPISPSRGGIAGMLLLFCVAGGGAGLAFDFLSDSGQDFWILQAPGMRALIGVAVAALLLVAAHILRLLLGRKVNEGEPRAGLRP
ncbi:MAG TPA: hypothetical protein VHC73_05310 [Vitreimonas sp.]|jgi:hypothetical protein|nr:hypothetical protein [Vitreimonas sp.]